MVWWWTVLMGIGFGGVLGFCCCAVFTYQVIIRYERALEALLRGRGPR